MNSLITTQQLKPILDDIGAQAIQLLRTRINSQKEVDGSPFPPLASSTIRAKQRAGGGVEGNATLRMKATNDFVMNAYEYKVENDGVRIFISKKIHKLSKIASARRKWETNQAKGKKQKTSKPTYTNSRGEMVTYEDIALYNLRGSFDCGWRKPGNPGNPGADFFGLSKSNEEKLNKIFVAKIKPIIETNIMNAIVNACKK